MKTCPNCGAQLVDEAMFCGKCGSQLKDENLNARETVQMETPAMEEPEKPYYDSGVNQHYSNAQSTYQPVPEPWDHTAEYDAKDISDNKVVAMLGYLLGVFGIIIALLGSNTSPYAQFHVRQALKFLVVDALVTIIAVLLCWTIIVPAAAGIFEVILEVIKIICFISVCKGQAKEPAIIRGLEFLK